MRTAALAGLLLASGSSGGTHAGPDGMANAAALGATAAGEANDPSGVVSTVPR